MEVSWSSKKHTTKEKLPHDLVIEILSWLHVKHLFPLRFVSKSWFHLLTKDSQFAKFQFHRFKHSHPDPSIIGIRKTMKDRIDSELVLATEFTSCHKAFPVKFPFHQPPNTCYRISGIANGLLCISPSRDINQVYIWNPLINDHITISCLQEPEIRFPCYKGFTKFGFGFDQVSNVYKVVRFFTEIEFEDILEEYDSQTQISVYTIGVDSAWRTVEVDIPHDLSFLCGIIPFVNGAFHWCKRRPGTDSRDLIVTFDLNEEVISKFMVPPYIKVLEIVELNGMLCAIDTSSDKQQTQIWVMKEYGVLSSWSKQYVFEKPKGYMSILGITHDGEIILRRIFNNLFLYNPETNTMKDLKKFQFEALNAYAFLGSIISPTAISQGGTTCLKRKDEEAKRKGISMS